MVFDAVGAIAANALTSGRNISLEAGETVNLTGNADVTGIFRIQAGDIELNGIDIDAATVGFLATTGGIHATGTLDINGPVTIEAAGAVDMTGDILAPSVIDIRGASVALGNVTGGSVVGIAATNGAVNSDGTISAGSDLFISTTDGGTFDTLLAGDDIGITGSGDIRVALMDATGSNPQGEEIGSNVGIDIDGNVVVGHGEAAGDYIVNATSFTTGLNSIIADGNIEITTSGASNLGNSTAGGHIEVDAQSIAFNTLDAGDYVNLNANGTATGAEGIDGAAIVAASDVILIGNSITVGNIDAGGLLSAFGSGGDVAIGTAVAASNIGVIAADDIGGGYAADGDIEMSADGIIAVTANAAGGAPDPSNGDANTAGNAYFDAGGNVVLTDSSGAGMVGVRAGGSATLTGVTAGEDMLVLAGTTAALSDVTAGDDLDVVAAGDVTASNVAATGAGLDGFLLRYTAASGFTIGQGEGVSSLDGADIDIRSSGGAIAANGLSAGDDIFLTAATSLDVDGAETLGLGQTGGDSSIRTQSADATLAGLDAFSDVAVSASGAVGVAGPVAAGRDVTIDAGSVNVATLTTVVGGNTLLVDSIAAGRDIDIAAGDAIDAGALRAGRDLSLTAGTTVNVLQAVSGAGGTLSLSGALGVTGDSVISGGATNLTSDAGLIQIANLSSAGPVAASADAIQIAGPGSLIFSQLDADAGDASVTASGNLAVTSGFVAGTATLRSTNGDLAVTQLQAADVRLDADDDMTLGTVTADATLIGEAGGVLTVNGGVTGRQMALGSSDIVIDSNGRLGTGGTTEILDIRNTSNTRVTFIGGTGTRDGYHIDQTEMTRLFGNDITIFAPKVDENLGGFVAAAPGALPVPIASIGSSEQPDVVIDDFTMTAGGSTANLGASGSLTIATPGKARVIGDVSLTGMSDGNSLNIFADDALEVILGEGTIKLTGSGTALGGMLNLQSDDVIVATAGAIADVGSATGIDAIDDRLAQNDGILLDEGALAAGGIDVSVVGGFYVQNSGAGDRFAQRRGLTFGPLGLNVNVEGSATRIVINGVHLGSSGQVTGLDAIPLLSIDGFVIGSGPLAGSGLAFDSGSTMNGCLIVSSTTCAFLEFESSFPVQDVIRDREDDGEEGDDAEGMGLPIPLITMRSLDPLTGQPLLDDPVTGAGNDDLWTPPSE
ncbi:beta strand repeat-containing protein [Sphingopyxis sp. PET50]|uniref:beta strand repeat-containing protein n=1 Tax=Sphingopyxis sp. PET50 TaxID=2976533 RepID=UPI0021AFE7E5|nr:hypothetical protein [Sphingopyxis sp. PET50]